MESDETDLLAVSRAEKDAKKFVDGENNDYEMYFRMKIAKEIGIGLWDSYFDNLSTYQLAFEAFFYTALEQKQRGVDPEKEADELVKMLQDDKIIMPSGFGQDDEESEFVEVPLKDLSGLS